MKDKKFEPSPYRQPNAWPEEVLDGIAETYSLMNNSYLAGSFDEAEEKTEGSYHEAIKERSR
ncbi:hypothetical protein [Bacillus marinisedimentorum]|uniref:hypothetical protein n=1 Tax=Bacillus marinisedimentorum TaxID=1821260 RepID=UPI000871DBFE|nr:hypothetical protein [Bacillus marinisedimentorum]